jgi:hypothetical protein
VRQLARLDLKLAVQEFYRELDLIKLFKVSRARPQRVSRA